MYELVQWRRLASETMQIDITGILDCGILQTCGTTPKMGVIKISHYIDVPLPN